MQERMSLIAERRKDEASLIKKERRWILKKKEQIEKAYFKTNQMRRIEIQIQAKEGLERVE